MKVAKNLLVSFGGQLIISLLGIVFPRLLIDGYGSDANGVLNTIAQILGYMTILDAGIGRAARNALYEPIADNNHGEISHIASLSQRSFRGVAQYYGIGIIVLSAILPFILKSELDYVSIALAMLLQGMAGVVELSEIQTRTIILVADGRGYMNSLLHTCGQILSYAIRIVLAYMGVSIILLQVAFFVVTVVRALAYKIYFRKKYCWIDFKKSSNHEQLKDGKAYVIADVALIMFFSTDMIVLSIMISTQLASVYSVYNMVYVGVASLVNTAMNSITYLLGQAYYKDKDHCAEVYDVLLSGYVGIMTMLMSALSIMMPSFIRLYTQDVADINYMYIWLPILFGLVQIVYGSFHVSDMLTGIAGYAKSVSRASVVATAAKVLLSVVLAAIMGIEGVLIATVIALPIMVIYRFFIADKRVFKRSYLKTLRIMGINVLVFGIVSFLGQSVLIDAQNYGEFVLYGLVVTLCCVMIGVGMNLLVNPKCFAVLRDIKKKDRY